MKRAILPVALLLASGFAQAHSDTKGVHFSCDIGSRYSVDSYRRAFLFSQEQAKPAEVGIGGGRLFIDGKEASLSPADQQRMRQLDMEMQQLLPEVQRVTIEAVDIAFTALTEVARALSSTPQVTVSSLENAHQRVRREMSAKPLVVFNEDAMGGIIKPLLSEYVPQIVGGAVSSALKAVFAGDKESSLFEARMQRMEHELDTRVDARAKALEPLAESMCQRLRRIDAIDDALEFRLPDGERLQLLRTDRQKRTDAP